MTIKQLNEAVRVLGANFKVRDFKLTSLVPKGWG